MTSRIAKPLAVLATFLSVSSAFAQAPAPPSPTGQNTPQSVVRYWLEAAPAPRNGAVDVVEHGKWLFRQKGCFLCHGPAGQGGIPNRNYMKDTIPALALAEQMKLYEAEDVSAVLEQMKRGVHLDTLASAPPTPQFNVVLAQYHSIQDVIRKGNPAGRKDPKGPAPPLNMPSWGRELSDADIDSLIAFMLTLQVTTKN